MDLSTPPPDYIPADVQKSWLDDARTTVAHRPRQAALEEHERRLTRVAVAAGTIGFAVFSLLWVGLAIGTADPLWWGFAAAGALIAALAGVALRRMVATDMTASPVPMRTPQHAGSRR